MSNLSDTKNNFVCVCIFLCWTKIRTSGRPIQVWVLSG